MKKHHWLVALGCVWLVPGPLAWGQGIPDLSTALDLASGPRPERGWSMNMVRRQFGKPVRRLGPVGQPPISQWVYPDFVVYFERQYTIHAVWTAPSSVPSLERETQDSTLHAP